MPEPTWQLDAVSFRHPRADRDAVREISCAIGDEGLTAIVGPNGAGKSTLAHLLAGLQTPTRGAITFRQRPIGAWSRIELAQQVGFVPQGEEGVFPLTARQLVAMGRFPYLGPWQRTATVDDETVLRALHDVGAERFADRTMQTLSGGERQRVRVARALAQDASVLLLDEPTASLDVRHEVELFELLRRLADANTRVVVVTHHLSLAAQLADSVLLLAQGQVIASGASHAVLTSETLTAAYEWPVDVVQHGGPDGQLVPLVMPRVTRRTRT